MGKIGGPKATLLLNILGLEVASLFLFILQLESTSQMASPGAEELGTRISRYEPALQGQLNNMEGQA